MTTGIMEVVKTCAWCNGALGGRRGTKFCSRECNSKASGYRRTLKRKAERVSVVKACEFCAGEYTPSEYTTGRQKYCSTQCQSLSRAKYRDLDERPCAACHVGFIPASKIRPDQRFCSNTCRLAVWNRENRQKYVIRRRALKAQVPCELVVPTVVYERDNYMCYLCKIPTDVNVEYPHPDYPTVDHVIPLSAGGTHTMSNCRCACWYCNLKKGDLVPTARQLEKWGVAT